MNYLLPNIKNFCSVLCIAFYVSKYAYSFDFDGYLMLQYKVLL